MTQELDARLARLEGQLVELVSVVALLLEQAQLRIEGEDQAAECFARYRARHRAHREGG